MAETKKSLWEKILSVQEEIGAIERTRRGARSKYFDINDIKEVLVPLMAKHRLVEVQPVVLVDGRNALRNIIRDLDSAEELSFDMALPETKSDQDTGSSLTYNRRYWDVGFWCIRAEDDDGQRAGEARQKAVDAEAAVAKLRGARSMDELQKIWAKLSPAEKKNKGVEAVKDEMKEGLTLATADIPVIQVDETNEDSE